MSDDRVVTATVEKGEQTRRTRQYTGVAARAITAFTASWALYLLLYITGLYSYVGLYIRGPTHKAVALAGGMVIIYLLYPAVKRASRRRLPWYDALAILLCVLVNIYVIVSYDRLISLPAAPTTFEIVLGLIAVALVLEATRRTIGVFLTVICFFFFIYPLITHLLPGFLHFRPFSLADVITMVYLFPEGIYGSLLSMFCTVMVGFLIFGAFLEGTGAGTFFVQLAVAVAGRFRGGPAKVAVLASALFGSINGSAQANVASTGAVTIPMMKRAGFQPHFAGAVEAVASNGGQIMPPVMGVAVFLMIDFLETSYRRVIIAAIVPALVYFTGLLFMVHLQAVKTGLAGLPRRELPSLTAVLKEGWFYFIPLTLLLFLIMYLHYSPQTAVMYTLGSLILVTLFKKETRMTPRKVIYALDKGARITPPVVAAVGVAGTLTATIALTGIGFKLGGGLIDLAGGNLATLVVMAGALCIVLGMGLPTTGVYILAAILLAPALILMGVDPFSAHFFVLFMGTAALITPPFCVAAYVAAAIADAPFMKTGWEASRLGIAVYLLPFIFVFSPELLLIGSPVRIAVAVFTSLIGILLISCGIQGYLFRSTTWLERILFLIGGLMMLVPDWQSDLVGFALGILVCGLNGRWWLIASLTGKNITTPKL